MSKQQSITPTSAEIHAQAVADGFMNEEGFFVQSDAEFELDVLQAGTAERLKAHIDGMSVDPETAAFLRDFLVQSKDVHFEPFSD